MTFNGRNGRACALHDGSARERRLPLAGTRNFRDVGGYAAADGRRVRWGLVYRSDDLSALSGDAQTELLRLGLRTVFDLRGSDEVESEPDRLPAGAAIDVLCLPISHESFAPRFLRESILAGAVDGLDESYMVRAYRHMVAHFAPTFGRVFERLASPGGVPAVIHCAGGKDRTGVAIALLLLALGVPENVIVEDYALTNLYAAARMAELRAMLDRILPNARGVHAIVSASPLFIEAALAEVQVTFGSLSAYLREAAGVDDETLEGLRAVLLEDVPPGGGPSEPVPV